MALSDNQRWNLSAWVFPSIIPLVLAWITIGLEVPMTALMLTIGAVWIFLCGLVWLLTPPATHRFGKIAVTALLTTVAACSLCWVWKYDRPILTSQIGEVVANVGPNDSLIYVEALVKNTGHQNSYIENWNFEIATDSLMLSGVEKFSQKRPDGTVDEPQLFDQEFPVGKPVRGWLYFIVHDVSSAQMHKLFKCSAPPSHAKAILSFTDNKERHLWTQTRNLSDLIHAGCGPLSTMTATPQSIPAVSTYKPRKPVLPPTTPATIINAPRGVVSTGQQGGVTAGTINIYPPSPAQVPTAITHTQDGNTITLRTNNRIDSVSLVLRFDADVSFVSNSMGSCMQCGNGSLNGPDGRPDLKTIWPFWTFPAFLPENPLTVKFSSAAPAKLLGVSKGPPNPIARRQ